MFNQRKAGGSAPPPQPCATNDTQAKEKLQGYVYEYLLLSGATKTAESFKTEVLSLNNYKHITTAEAPGFLQNWWLVFWDLYSAAPDRRDSCEATQEAKAFHEYGFIQQTFAPPPGSMVNGIHSGQNPSASPLAMGNDGMPLAPGYFPPRSAGGPPSQSNQASPISGWGDCDWMHGLAGHPPAGQSYAVPGRYGPPGRGGTPGMPPNAQPGMAFGPPGGPPPPHMFPADSMRPIAAQRLPPNAMRMQAGFPGMRPNAPVRYSTQQMHFIDSPGGTPFPQNAMMSNGAICTSASMMNSPGPMQPLDGQPDPRFMMAMSSSSAMPFMNEGGGPPGGVPGGEMLINGEDMKQSPASTHGGLNGGTPGPPGGPGSQQTPGGPGSAAPRPASAGGPGSAQSAATAANGPENMDYTQQSAGGGGQPPSHGDGRAPTYEQTEIAKIKQSMMEDFAISVGKDESAGDYTFPAM